MNNPGDNFFEQQDADNDTYGSAMWKSSEALFNELRVNEQKAIEVFSKRDKFAKLNKDQISLLIYAHGVSVLRAIYCLEDLLSKVNIKNIVGAAEENRELSLFIINTPVLSALCYGDELVRMVEVAKEILERNDLVEKISVDQKRVLEDASQLSHLMRSTGKLK